MIGTNFVGTQVEIIQALGERVQIQQDFFCGLKRALLAAINLVLLTFNRPGIIVIIILVVWDRQIGFLDAVQHIFIERFLQALGIAGNGFGVFVFSRQVGEDRRVTALSEPIVVVRANIAKHRVNFGFYLCYWGNGFDFADT